MVCREPFPQRFAAGRREPFSASLPALRRPAGKSPSEKEVIQKHAAFVPRHEVLLAARRS